MKSSFINQPETWRRLSVKDEYINSKALINPRLYHPNHLLTSQDGYHPVNEIIIYQPARGLSVKDEYINSKALINPRLISSKSSIINQPEGSRSKMRYRFD